MKKFHVSEEAMFSLSIVVFSFLMVVLLFVSITPNINHDPVPVEHQQYLTTGYYYDGYVIRDDGHIWDYETALVEPDSPVCIVFDDNCTPNDVTDDYIVNMKALD